MKNIKIYLAGSIPKGDEIRKGFVDWREEYRMVLSKIKNIEFPNPDNENLNEEDSLFVFGRDCHLIQTSDLIIIDAKDKIGAGTAQEILIAKYFKKPVITIMPKNTHHRKSNVMFGGKVVEDWIHPFIYSTSDVVVEKIEDATRWIRDYINDPKSKKIKTIKVIDKGIMRYLENNT